MEPTEIFELTEETFMKFQQLIDASPWRDIYHSDICRLIDSLSEPCKLAVTGRVKAGKSSLINVILGNDYAKVGTSETTATINIFKFGNPPIHEKPILCEYIDGRKEWISQEHLDSLQGNTNAIIKNNEEIKDLIYYIEDERLKNTILIDTPGIDAVVGDEGDSHQKQTESFLGLRRQHEKDTITISNNADAVILLLGDVVHESDKDFIDAFLKNRGNTSCMNTIGVLSQIDLTDERIENRLENAKSRYEALSSYLNCVVPISSGLKRYKPNRNEAKLMKDFLKKIKSRHQLDNLLLSSERMYFLPTIPSIDLSLEERKRIYHQGTVPFRCFAVYLKILYDHSIDEALNIIDDISGINELTTLLNNQFFSRSHQIKCDIAIRNALSIIWEIVNCKKVESNENNSENYDFKAITEKLREVQSSFEELLQETELINNCFKCFTLVTENSELFTKDELEELKLLFSIKSVSFNNDRMNYWYSLSNNAKDEKVRYVANGAYLKYTDLAFCTNID